MELGETAAGAHLFGDWGPRLPVASQCSVAPCQLVRLPGLPARAHSFLFVKLIEEKTKSKDKFRAAQPTRREDTGRQVMFASEWPSLKIFACAKLCIHVGWCFGSHSGWSHPIQTFRGPPFEGAGGSDRPATARTASAPPISSAFRRRCSALRHRQSEAGEGMRGNPRLGCVWGKCMLRRLAPLKYCVMVYSNYQPIQIRISVALRVFASRHALPLAHLATRI